MAILFDHYLTNGLDGRRTEYVTVTEATSETAERAWRRAWVYAGRHYVTVVTEAHENYAEALPGDILGFDAGPLEALAESVTRYEENRPTGRVYTVSRAWRVLKPYASETEEDERA